MLFLSVSSQIYLWNPLSCSHSVSVAARRLVGMRGLLQSAFQSLVWTHPPCACSVNLQTELGAWEIEFPPLLWISPQCFLDGGLSFTDCLYTSICFAFPEIHKIISALLDLFFPMLLQFFFFSFIFTVFSLGFYKGEGVSVDVQSLLLNGKYKINILVLCRGTIPWYLRE